MILGLVCARAGSEGVPGKNLLELDGVSLIEWSIIKCLAAEHVDFVAVTTDIDTGDTVRTYQAENGKVVFRIPRPDELAGPKVSKWPVYQHAVRVVEELVSVRVSAVVDVDVSRPLTTPGDVDATLEAFVKAPAPVMLAIGHAKKTPYQDIYERDVKSLNLRPSKAPPFERQVECRQDAPVCWYHGGILVIDRNALLGCDHMWDLPVDGHEIEADHCHDIDYPSDWLLVKALWEVREPCPTTTTVR